jgi:hypothetical protein
MDVELAWCIELLDTHTAQLPADARFSPRNHPTVLLGIAVARSIRIVICLYSKSAKADAHNDLSHPS